MEVRDPTAGTYDVLKSRCASKWRCFDHFSQFRPLGGASDICSRDETLTIFSESVTPNYPISYRAYNRNLSHIFFYLDYQKWLNILRTFIVIVFRLLPAIFLGEGIYGDEHDQFDCITTQPGCENICFTLFSPIQPPRMWCLQILLSSLPPTIFTFFAAREQAKGKRYE